MTLDDAIDVRRAVETLRPREQEVVSRRFGLDGGGTETLQSIANDFGLSKERIRTIQAAKAAQETRPAAMFGPRELATGLWLLGGMTWRVEDMSDRTKQSLGLPVE